MFLATVVIIILFTFLALKRLDWALLVLIASLPTYLIRFEILGLPLTLLEGFILVAATAWFFKHFLPANKQLLKFNFKRESGRTNYPYWREILLLIIISFVAVGVSGFSFGALGIWKAYFFEPILLFLIILNTFKDKDGYQKILMALALSVASVSFFAIYQKVTGDFISNPFWAASETRRVVSFFGYPNAVGLFLAPLSIMLLGWFLSWGKEASWLKKLILGITVLAAWAAIFFASSDGGIIAVMFGVLVMSFLYSHKSRVIILTLTLLFLISIPVLGLHKTSLADKLQLQDLSGEIRKQQWRETWNMLKDGRLLMGAGLDNYQVAVRPYHQEGLFFNFDKRENFDAVVWASPELQKIYWQPVEIYLYPHNIILNFWSELGLLGTIIFLWLICRAIFVSYQTTKIPGVNNSRLKFLPLGILSALIAIIIHGLVDVPYFKNDLAVMFWIILALGTLFELNNKQRPEELLSIK